MVKLFTILFLISFGAQGQSIKLPGRLNGTPPAPPDTAYVFVINGQSNAGSFGGGLQSQYTTTVTNINSWDTVTKVFTQYASLSGNTEKGLQLQTAGLETVAHGWDSAYVLRISQGSQPITGWYNSNGLMKIYQDSVIAQSFRYLRSRGFYVKVKSTIWLQGEADCTAGTAVSTYQEKLDTVINRYRALDPALENSQFVIVKLMEGSGGGTYVTTAVNLDVAFTNLASTKTNVGIIRPEDEGCTLVDTVHYTPASFILIANAWSALIP